MQKLRKIFLTVSILCLTISISNGQEYLNGVLSGTIGPGTYIVNGDCEVASGTSLTILPGTTLMHNGHHTWQIYGRLIAEGPETDSIKFVREQPIPSHRWGGLRFAPTIPVQNSLTYCVVDNGYNTGDISGGGIYLSGNFLTLQHSSITNCEAAYPGNGGGIYAYYATALIIEDCLIEGNSGSSGAGIYLNFSHGAQVKNCIIINNDSPAG